MNLPYSVRLLVLSGASYFLIHTALATLTLFGAGKAVRLAEQMRPRTSARFLLAVRILPMVLTLLVLFGLCIPSYLWLEPGATAEEVGFACVLMACLGVLAWAISVQRVIVAITGTARYMRRCQHEGHEATLPGDPSPVLVLEGEAPVLAMAGVVHSQLVVSQCVVRSLSPDQMDAARRHERAHQLSRDNLKRLLILMTPDILPFVRGFAAVERSWAKFTEWSADDHAVGGDSHRALSLASALVAVARMSSKPRLPSLIASLVADDLDLSERVDRLLHAQPAPGKSLRSVLPMIGGAGVVVVSCTALLLMWPASLSLVHNMLERLVR
jgi:Zn-dependent protease with chaperone function